MDSEEGFLHSCLFAEKMMVMVMMMSNWGHILNNVQIILVLWKLNMR